MSYLPNATDSGRDTWKTDARIREAAPGQRFRPLSSGSSRNYRRGWTGAPEVEPGGFTAAGQTLVSHYTRATLFGVGEQIIDRELTKHEQDNASTASRLGAPDPERNRIRPSERIARQSTVTHSDGSPLGLPAGPRPMAERVERLALPAAGESSAPRVLFPETEGLPRVGQTENARSWLPDARPVAETGPQRRRAQPALGAAPQPLALPAAGGTSAPRVQFPETPGLPRPGQTSNARSSVIRPSGNPEDGGSYGFSRVPPALPMGPASVVGQLDRAPSMAFGGTVGRGPAPDARRAAPASAPDDRVAPSARQKGRRAPAGMDARKRGTWMNYE